MKMPLFSLIIPTYNREQLIGKTLQSVLAQNFTDFEVLVVDDGSKDNTESVVKSLSDERIVYFRKENGERGAARNYGIERAKGSYVTFLDSDDLLYPNHFEEAEKLIHDKNAPAVFHLAYEYRDEQGKLLSVKQHAQDLNRQLIKGNVISCIGIFVKREIFADLKFCENRKLSGTEDWLLWLRLASRYKFEYSDTITACMINHDSRSVLNYDEREMLDRTNLLLQNLKEDAIFMEANGKDLGRIEAHMLSYISLHLALSGKKQRALKYLWQSALKSLAEVMTRRTLAILRLII
ncbi:MAG: glycosyltransferase [Chitinophagales bacterium]|nr:glycosyltransferase [Chitinophagales bacterium]